MRECVFQLEDVPEEFPLKIIQHCLQFRSVPCECLTTAAVLVLNFRLMLLNRLQLMVRNSGALRHLNTYKPDRPDNLQVVLLPKSIVMM